MSHKYAPTVLFTFVYGNATSLTLEFLTTGSLQKGVEKKDMPRIKREPKRKVPTCTKLGSCLEAEAIIENAFRHGGFPHSRVQKLFGMGMSESNGKGNPRTMTIGELVYYSWMTIRSAGLYCRNMVQEALVQDTLRLLFRDLLQLLLLDTSYTAELKQRNLDDIEWKNVCSDGEPPFPTLIQIHREQYPD